MDNDSKEVLELRVKYWKNMHKVAILEVAQLLRCAHVDYQAAFEQADHETRQAEAALKLLGVDIRKELREEGV